MKGKGKQRKHAVLSARLCTAMALAGLLPCMPEPAQAAQAGKHNQAMANDLPEASN